MRPHVMWLCACTYVCMSTYVPAWTQLHNTCLVINPQAQWEIECKQEPPCSADCVMRCFAHMLQFVLNDVCEEGLPKIACIACNADARSKRSCSTFSSLLCACAGVLTTKSECTCMLYPSMVAHVNSCVLRHIVTRWRGVCCSDVRCCEADWVLYMSSRAYLTSLARHAQFCNARRNNRPAWRS